MDAANDRLFLPQIVFGFLSSPRVAEAGMVRRSKLVCRLSAAVVAIPTVGIALSGYLGKLIYDRQNH